jgi:hypothetical protein
MPAYRVAFRLHYGYKPAKGRHICHRCNNKCCCNPHHLYDGTAATNHKDAVEAGVFKYLVPKCGEDHPRAKLTVDTVIFIRKVHPLLKRHEKATLARLCGINTDYMRRIASGEGWTTASHQIV